jgi:shikimate kinase
VTVVATHVVLVGLMGAGKTSIGKRVAKRLGRRFVDSDQELERATGKTARQLLADEGVESLHAREAAVVDGALASDEPLVVGAPASIVLAPAMRDRLRQEHVVWLRADPHWLTEKMAQSDNEQRPFVDTDPDVLVRLHAERAPLYEDVASVVVESTRRDKDEVAAEIVDRLGLT